MCDGRELPWGGRNVMRIEIEPSLQSPMMRLTRPRHYRNAGGGVEIVARTRFQSMPRQHILRRGIRSDLGEYGKPAGNSHVRGARQMERVVELQEHAEHLGAANNGDHAAGDAEL